MSDEDLKALYDQKKQHDLESAKLAKQIADKEMEMFHESWDGAIEKIDEILESLKDKTEEQSKDAIQKVQKWWNKWQSHFEATPAKGSKTTGKQGTQKPRAIYKNPDSEETYASRGPVPTWMKEGNVYQGWIQNWEELDERARKAARNLMERLNP